MKNADRTSLACTETWTFLFLGFVWYLNLQKRTKYNETSMGFPASLSGLRRVGSPRPEVFSTTFHKSFHCKLCSKDFYSVNLKPWLRLSSSKSGTFPDVALTSDSAFRQLCKCSTAPERNLICNSELLLYKFNSRSDLKGILPVYSFTLRQLR